ncbi:AraC family transcriptional regulator, regulatory protein of adaptative response / methylated-DNA-[protein]-cysteine methyltransferase [Marinobacter sp. es.048]|uniref:bifunctional transcriptional activator/DNA repair enzyme AdaA n=1 Tax=Marinobacter sp. es.048 TaxID=1761795 RepID=UPI000B591B63|nr:methylated-DNA--[protein]-cysteine S-methyltransferase [Marinobacter sp. es.048]SNC64307.1 AraC family transcriptional regulator, regulatory protein of adaptative response / methylated-DNA-[protein]-cysteine methyltransferase [Marinobacter sp. es.048]
MARNERSAVDREPELSASAPDRMVELARFIESRPDERLTLEDMAAFTGLSASHVQRAFKKTFGVSPKTYQDALRLKAFKQALKRGQTVTDAIYDAGFGSVSRVYGKADRRVGMPPSRYGKGGEGETITHACRQTSLGLLMMAATDQGVCFAEFGDDEAALQDRLQREFPKARLVPSGATASPELDAWIAALDEHLSQNTPRPDVPLDIRGTAFQTRVWKLLLSVREGEIVSYTELAKRLGEPKAVRAVASACGRNRIAVLIPCHRVLRSDGSLGGYRWGLDRKQQLLEQERSASAQ